MSGIWTAVSAGWTAISTWITSTLGSLQSVFYAEGELTFMGALSVIGVGIGVIFLLVGVIQNFLHLRG